MATRTDVSRSEAAVFALCMHARELRDAAKYARSFIHNAKRIVLWLDVRARSLSCLSARIN